MYGTNPSIGAAGDWSAFMDIYDIMMSPLEKSVLAPIRKRIIPMASGNVLEFGYGTGVNFKYYRSERISSLCALDIDLPPEVHAGTGFPIPVQFYKGRAEQLPFADNLFDCVVETLVLCSVSDLPAVISEVHRVLKPGGSFIFLDHVLPERKALLIEASGFRMEHTGKTDNSIFRWGIGINP